ncbi:predicted protein [Pyrenophora tritici-repentis Pt-1C-BFP]|uniref:Uncharacterized protein n=1 Tax=Pyrenophora tritici-repentis (strain Pt-1C-BFP) TaxID=426418 RepID=B2VUH4_PYRTR|nr:uncharacterized protein PTRG_01030 [Pyrenophora tritici-repentis Pt-1C-BFP]EDU40468.1 predicted protein [Pyrenophora tritici-repentis Pt-1C-BFP]
MAMASAMDLVGAQCDADTSETGLRLDERCGDQAAKMGCMAAWLHGCNQKRIGHGKKGGVYLVDDDLLVLYEVVVCSTSFAGGHVMQTDETQQDDRPQQTQTD